MIQQFSQAFAAGASRVEIYKLRNSADHPESIEPFGLLRADDSRRPAFDAYRAMTTYLRDFRGVAKQQLGDVVAFTFDRGGQTTTVLWTWGRTPARVRVKAIAPEGLLVDERGRTSPIKAADGVYLIDLPGASCSNSAACAPGIGGRAAAAGGSGRGGWPGRAHPAADIDAHTHAHPDGDEHSNPQPHADRKLDARAVAIADRHPRSAHAYRHRGASNADCGSIDRHSRCNFSGDGGRDASGRARERPDLDLRHTDRRQCARRRPGRSADRSPRRLKPPETVIHSQWVGACRRKTRTRLRCGNPGRRRRQDPVPRSSRFLLLLQVVFFPKCSITHKHASFVAPSS